MMTDPIADMLTRIRNSAAARRSEVRVPLSKVKFTLAKILEKSGFVASSQMDEEKHELVIRLRYDGRVPSFASIKRISKPGRRVYAKTEELPTVRSGHGLAIISTSQGMMTNVEAKARKLGGEIICEIY
jgi:small subunit ribosomal protein S8